MVNDSSSDAEQMLSERFKTNGPPGRRQGFSLHHGEDIVGEGIEPPPSGIGKKSFRGHHASCQIIFDDITLKGTLMKSRGKEGTLMKSMNLDPMTPSFELP